MSDNNPHNMRALFAARMHVGDEQAVEELTASHIYQGIGIKNAQKKLVALETRYLGAAFEIETPLLVRAKALHNALMTTEQRMCFEQFTFDCRVTPIADAVETVARVALEGEFLALAASKPVKRGGRRGTPVVVFPLSDMWPSPPYTVAKQVQPGLHVATQSLKLWIAKFGPYDLEGGA